VKNLITAKDAQAIAEKKRKEREQLKIKELISYQDKAYQEAFNCITKLANLGCDSTSIDIWNTCSGAQYLFSDDILIITNNVSQKLKELGYNVIDGAVLDDPSIRQQHILKISWNKKKEI